MAGAGLGLVEWRLLGKMNNIYLCCSPSPRAWEGNGTPLQYSCLENPMDRGAWWDAVHGVTRSRTRLSDFPLFFHFHALEKEMATHSSVLAWRIPGTGEPGRLPSMGSQSRTRLKRLSSSSSSRGTFGEGNGTPDGLPSMGLHRVRHDWSDLSSSSSRGILIYTRSCSQEANN